jgi:membrane protease YdiL (CAAX protease family)
MEGGRLRSLIIPSRFSLLLEFLGLFVATPALVYCWAPLPILPLLWVFAFCCGRVLLRDAHFDRANLWRLSALTGSGSSVLLHFAVCAAALFALVYLLAPHRVFALVREQPALWLLIIFMYPLLSVYPQELIYRAYFLHRYRALFPHKWSLLTLNAVLFGYMHIIFHNWIAVALTVPGGMLFAMTYERSRSTLLVSVQHSLFGCLLFTLGLGQFFQMGAFSTFSEGLGL